MRRNVFGSPPVAMNIAIVEVFTRSASTQLSSLGVRANARTSKVGETVTGLEPRGSLVRLTAVLGDGAPLASDLTVAAAVDAGLVAGSEVWLAVKAAQVSLYPR